MVTCRLIIARRIRVTRQSQYSHDSRVRQPLTVITSLNSLLKDPYGLCIMHKISPLRFSVSSPLKELIKVGLYGKANSMQVRCIEEHGREPCLRRSRGFGYDALVYQKHRLGEHG